MIYLSLGNIYLYFLWLWLTCYPSPVFIFEVFSSLTWFIGFSDILFNYYSTVKTDSLTVFNILIIISRNRSQIFFTGLYS